MSPKSVLVVEDDEALRTSIEMLLQVAEIPVRVASNGLEALARITDEMPDLILLDMKMPVMDGWEFVKRFRETFGSANSCIIVVTAAEDARKRAEEVQACCSIGKPFDADSFITSILDHLAGRMHQQVA
jgi:CheY-like chemotaxis protein